LLSSAGCAAKLWCAEEKVSSIEQRLLAAWLHTRKII
jgi:hypothetical protein